jgi:AcrR family transcriptional regulator
LFSLNPLNVKGKRVNQTNAWYYVGTMARPPAEATKKRILRAAAALFAEQGVGRTTVREIAKAADVNVAMVSHHFGGKEPLYRACLEAMYAELDGMQGELLAALSESDGLKGSVRRAVVAGYRYAIDHRAAARLVMRHVLDTGELPPTRRERHLPFLETTSRALAPATARSVEELRFIVQSLMFLITRYSLSTSAELAAASGRPTRSATETQHLVEDQLTRQALWLLGLAEPQSEGATER